ncbi:UNKNOWN [Stylonychia lemnae]|uniref:Uncharacterized protein n=1 Tax=Stylonychia lemnae TaxID=5949 RepID=A0A078AW88_STYLE|nr:UNKNOWN [Stylonychia lemnae]|eukprot:CDW86399.1 UNKNOWN [Stylonychia lemnae]
MIETNHKNQQKDTNIIWNRLKRAQTQHHLSNKDAYKSQLMIYEDKHLQLEAYTPRDQLLSGNGSSTTKAKGSLLQQKPSTGSQTGKNTANMLPFEQFHLEDEIKPLTARLKRSYFNIATMDQVNLHDTLRKQMTEFELSKPQTCQKDKNPQQDYQATENQVEKQLQYLGDGQIQKFLSKKFLKLDKRTLVQNKNKKMKRVASQTNVDQMSKFQELQQNQNQILQKNMSQQNMYYSTRDHMISEVIQTKTDQEIQDQNELKKTRLLIQQNQYLLEQFKKDLNLNQIFSVNESRRSPNIQFLKESNGFNQSEDMNGKKWINQQQEPKSVGQQLQQYFQQNDIGYSSSRIVNPQVDLGFMPRPKYITTLDKNIKKIKALKTPKNNYMGIKIDKDFVEAKEILKKSDSSVKLRFNKKTLRLEEIPIDVSEADKNLKRRMSKRVMPLLPEATAQPEKEIVSGSTELSVQLFHSKLRKGLLRKLGIQIKEEIQSREESHQLMVEQKRSQRVQIENRIEEFKQESEEDSFQSESDLETARNTRESKKRRKTIFPSIVNQAKSLKEQQEERNDQYNKLMTNLINLEQQQTRKNDVTQTPKSELNIPNFMRNALRHKLEQISVNIMKDTVESVIGKLQQKQDHFEKLNSLCQIINTCERNIESENNRKDSTQRVIMKTEFIQKLNENIESKLIDLINNKIEERNYMKLVYDMNNTPEDVIQS